VLAVAVLLAGLGVVGLALELPSFWDPCMSWGIGGSGNGTHSMTLSPGDECPSASGTSETRTGAAVRLALVDGTAIVAAALAATGAWRRKAIPTAIAAFLMAGETVLLFFGLSIAFVVSLAAAILFAVAAARWRHRGGAATASDGL
jgi:hypothetical protein